MLGLRDVCALGHGSTEYTCRSTRASAERRYRRAPLRGAIHIVITKLLYLLSLIEGGGRGGQC